MTKNEFLAELENSLEGKLPQDEIREILTDYTDIFESGIYDGKSEESMSSELGSPAKIARKILEDIPVYAKDNHSRLQTPKNYTDTRNLASLSTRFGAYVVDTIIGSIILFIILFASFLPFSTKETVIWSEFTGGYGYEAKLYKDRNGVTKSVQVLDEAGKKIFNGNTEEFSNFLDINKIHYPADFKAREYVITSRKHIPVKITLLISLLLLGSGNLFNSLITWKYNGYTIGKKLFKIKVEKIDGSKISFIDAVFRELVIKSILNVLFGGLINLGSFIWACFSDEQNTVHDRAAKTRVVSVKG